MAGAGQGDDRPAQVHRHRAGQAVHARREDAGDPRQAIQEAKAWFERQLRDGFQPFYEGEHWFFPADRRNDRERRRASSSRRTPIRSTPAALPTTAFFSVKHLGEPSSICWRARTRTAVRSTAGQLSPARAGERAGHAILVGGRLQTATTHAFIRNATRLSQSSQSPGLKKNADGSVNIYFGPKAPAGKQSNWVPTDAKGRFEVLFRFYGPQKPLFDKTWELPDIEEM